MASSPSEPEPLLDLTDRVAVVQAIETNALGALTTFGRLPGSEVHDGPDLFWCRAGVPIPFFNCVTRARLSEGEADAVIDATLEPYRARGLPMMWVVEPSSRPSDLADRLHRRKLAGEESSPWMAMGLDGLDDVDPPPGLSIERIGDSSGLTRQIHAGAVGFGAPRFMEDALQRLYQAVGLDENWSWYLGSVGGEGVATSALLRGGGVAGVYNVSTIPRVRRRGYGRAMTMAVLREARELGYRVAVLGSSPMGLGVYGRMGFREFCRFRAFLLASG